MAFKPGHKKIGGRKPGTPNKKTMAIEEAVLASGKDPLQTLLDLLDSPEVGIRLAAAKELCQYLYPKRKALEVSNPNDQGFKVILEDYSSTK